MDKEEFKRRIYVYIIRIIKFLRSIPYNSITREIVSQLMRSGTSIGANYFEAQSASSRKDFQNYFNHSLKSANETRFWLNLLTDANLLPQDSEAESRWLLEETSQLAKIFASSILTMKGQK